MKRTGGDAGLNLGGRQQRAARLKELIPKPVSDNFESEAETFPLEQWPSQTEGQAEGNQGT